MATPVASEVAGDIIAELDGVTSHGVPGKVGGLKCHEDIHNIN